MTSDDPEDGQSAFDDRVSAAFETLPPAEQRMARFFVGQKQAVLLGSAGTLLAVAVVLAIIGLLT